GRGEAAGGDRTGAGQEPDLRLRRRADLGTRLGQRSTGDPAIVGERPPARRDGARRDARPAADAARRPRVRTGRRATDAREGPGEAAQPHALPGARPPPPPVPAVTQEGPARPPAAPAGGACLIAAIERQSNGTRMTRIEGRIKTEQKKSNFGFCP